MKKGFIWTIIILLIIILIAVATDIFIHQRYQTDINNILKFDSSEFNNILSPIISTIGFGGLLLALYLTYQQLKSGNSQSFYDHYKNIFDKINYKGRKEERFQDNELINFWDFIEDIHYGLFNKSLDYLNDLEDFRNGLFPEKKDSYLHYLKNLCNFKFEALFLYKDYISLIKEILEQGKLTEYHKDILLDTLIGSILFEHLSNCSTVNEYQKNWIEDLYCDFKTNHKFFDEQFFLLYNFIIKDEKLKSYYDKHNNS